jgi:cell division protease FtsH
MIDDEVRKLIDSAYTRTKNLLVEKREKVEVLAEALLDREVLFQSDVEGLIGKRPYEEKKILEDDDKKAKDKHDTGVISEGVPPYDSEVTNHPPGL